jgi:hypothetical protein
MQYGNVESTNHIADLDESFGLDDALRIRGLFDRRSGPEESATALDEKIPVCKNHANKPDLGSWTPLDLLHHHRKKVVGRHVISEYVVYPDSGSVARSKISLL